MPIRQDLKSAKSLTSLSLNPKLNMTVPMENISPLLNDFVVNYRALMILAMVNAFGYAAPHMPHTHDGPRCFCNARAETKVLFITLTAVPKLSLSTEGRAAFLIKDAEALAVEAFREASRNKRHRLYDQDNITLL